MSGAEGGPPLVEVEPAGTEALALPEPGAPFHRLGCTPARRWWRPVAGLLVVAVLFAAAAFVIAGAAYAIHEPLIDASSTRFDVLWETGVVLLLAALVVPLVLLAVRRVERRPAGTVSSVDTGLRRGWLVTCSLVCGAAGLVAGLAVVLIDPLPADVDWVLVGGVAVVALALVPLQAAGEEYLFRGYLAQAVGAWVAGPWIPAVVLSLLFGAAHGTEQDVWLFLDRAGFGLVVAWLTIRTGGLEGAIAMHTLGNVLSFMLVAAYGDLRAYLGGDEPPLGPVGAALDLTVIVLLALALDRLAARRGLRRTWPAG